MPQFSNQALVDILADLAGVGKYLEGTTLHLVKDDFVATPATGAVELAAHEADYVGYVAGSVVTWLLPFIDQNGDGVLEADAVQFKPTDATVPNIIYGWWLQKGTGGTAKVIQFARLPEPAGLAGPFNSLIVDAQVIIPNSPP